MSYSKYIINISRDINAVTKMITIDGISFCHRSMIYLSEASDTDNAN